VPAFGDEFAGMKSVGGSDEGERKAFVPLPSSCDLLVSDFAPPLRLPPRLTEPMVLESVLPDHARGTPLAVVIAHDSTSERTLLQHVFPCLHRDLEKEENVER
jgi:hypothetical protein